MRNRLWLTAVCTLLVPVVGCQTESEQVAEVAREAAQRQAEQSKQMVQLQNQVAEGSRRLVEAEAKARADMTAIQRDLQQSQTEIGRQRDQLEVERRQIATERYWDALLGNSITAAAALLACLLPLLLCWALLRRPSHDHEADARWQNSSCRNWPAITRCYCLLIRLVRYWSRRRAISAGHRAVLRDSTPCLTNRFGLSVPAASTLSVAQRRHATQTLVSVNCPERLPVEQLAVCFAEHIESIPQSMP